MSSSVVLAIRWALAGFVGLYALSQLPVPLMVLGYKTGNLDVAAGADGATAGDSYERFVPLMEQMSAAQLVAGFAEYAFYLAGAVLLAFGWRRAPWVLAAGFVIGLAGRTAVRALPAWSETFSGRDTVVDVVTLAVLAAVGGATFWIAAQRPGRPV